MRRVFLSVFVIPAVLDASTIRHDVADIFYLEKGAEFSAVGGLSGRGLSGSGVYVGSNWVLTAGHVAFSKSGGVFELDGVDYSIAESVVHPDYRFGSNAHDIGLVRITGIATDNAGVPIRVFENDSEMFGLEVAWVGLGRGGDGVSGEAGVPGTLRGFTNTIDGYGDAVGLTSTSFISDFDSPEEDENSLINIGSSALATSLEGNVATGDSGGGIFLDGDLVGIISYQGAFDGSFDGSYGDLSGSTRLSLYGDWISEVSGITTIPEAGAMMFLVIATGLGASRRVR